MSPGRSRRIRSDRVLLAHGGGGLLTKELIESVILPVLDNPLLHPLDDSAVLRLRDCGSTGSVAADAAACDLAFTTDSYVVRPCSFPAVTSASWPCAARSTTWRSWAQSRCG